MSTEEKQLLQRIESKLDRLLGTAKGKPRAEWLTAAEFRKRSKTTPEQLRGIRERNPELVKEKPGIERGARYLYDWTAYSAIYFNS